MRSFSTGSREEADLVLCLKSSASRSTLAVGASAWPEWWANTDLPAALLISAGRRERWFFSHRRPASAASAASGHETAAYPQGDADQGGSSAAPAPSCGAPHVPGYSSRDQKYPRDSPSQEGTEVERPCPL